MKQSLPKKPRIVTIPPQSVARPSRPSKTGLSKSDPEYYAKIGRISAAKRKMSSEDFADMARKSHTPESRPEGYKGGRPKKESE